MLSDPVFRWILISNHNLIRHHRFSTNEIGAA
jgi:hypothetical protein